jgi:hypothetical protein
MTNAGLINTLSPTGNYGLSASASYLYYCNLLGNSIARVDLATGAQTQAMQSGLNGPRNVRYDPVSGNLYFLEIGTSAAQFKDGTLRVIPHS